MGARGAEVLSSRALNRATLERQLLLRRSDLTVEAAVERTVGLNAQSPNAPYLWLWSRLTDFELGDLTAAIEERRLVRSTMLRATQHLVAAGDFTWLRAVLQPLLERVQRNVFGKRVDGVDLAELVAAAREHLAGRMLTRPELGRLLGERWPGPERGALAWSVQYLEPVLHPAPSGTWNKLGSTPFVLASDWLGPLDTSPDPARLVRRYLAAYGPATVGDIRAWSGVSGLREVVDGLRTELRVFQDSAGRELFDLPDAPRPDPDVPAPVRFLAEFDNLLLAYADRTRVMTDEVRRRVCEGDAVWPTVLVDGAVRALWDITRDGTLTVRPFDRLSKAERDAITEEGTRLAAFAASTPDFRIASMSS